MSTPTIDFSKYEAQAPAPQIDFSKYAGGGSAPAQPVSALTNLDNHTRNILKEAGSDLWNSVKGAAQSAVGEKPTSVSSVFALPKFDSSKIGGPFRDAFNDARAAADRGDTTEAMFKSAAVPFAPVGINQIYDTAKSGNNDKAIGLGISRAAQVAAPEIAPRVAPAVANAVSGAGDALNSVRSSLAQKAVAPLVRKPAGAVLEDMKFGRNPAQAITDEGLSGSKQSILQQSQSRVGQLSDAVDQTLQNHPNANAKIDAGPIIDNAIDNAVSASKKTGNKAAVTRLENLREALKTEYGPTQGTPFEINNLKREVGQIGSDLGAFKSTDPLEASAAGAMADVYRGLKDAVNQQVPEIAPLNERIANLMSAQTGLKRNLALEENKSFLTGLDLANLPVKAVQATAGSAPVRSMVSKMLNAGQTLPEPAATPQITGAAAISKARFEAARAAAESKANAIPSDETAVTSKFAAAKDTDFYAQAKAEWQSANPGKDPISAISQIAQRAQQLKMATLNSKFMARSAKAGDD